jgi:chitinase
VAGNRLDAKFLLETTSPIAIDDHFTILKGCSGTGNVPPSVSITSPEAGATFTAGTNITVSAAANDCDGSVTKVEFFAGQTPLGEDLTAPYQVTWSNVPEGSYSLTAVATDNALATSTSAAVNITVNPAAAAPLPPTNLAATGAKRKVNLQWTQSTSANIARNRIYRSMTSGGPYTLIATINAATSYSDRGLERNTTFFYVVTAINGSGAESAYSNQASATAR